MCGRTIRNVTPRSSLIQRTSRNTATGSAGPFPKSFNASYGDLPYSEKLPHYNTQNLLARSLHPQCYQHNPGFLQFVKVSGLPFRPHEAFTKDDLEERGELYRRMAERIWNPADLLAESAP